MLLFGHLGIGAGLLRPWLGRLRLGAVLIGTLLPDVLDKPLYYGLRLLEAGDAGFISCTRTFGHSALLLVVLLAIAGLARRPLLISVALGALTHQLLDIASDFFTARGPYLVDQSAAAVAFAFPLFGFGFAGMPFDSANEHMSHSLSQPFNIVGELAGIAILAWIYRSRRAL